MTVERFEGKHRFLSNFYPSEIVHAGIRYPTVEHAYQACKTLDLDTRRLCAGMMTPRLAKSFGRAVKARDDWEAVKVQYMLTMLRKKFRDAQLRDALLETGDAQLVEGNTWGDTFWGVCDGVGQNMLGRLLMQVRQLAYNGTL